MFWSNAISTWRFKPVAAFFPVVLCVLLAGVSPCRAAGENSGDVLRASRGNPSIRILEPAEQASERMSETMLVRPPFRHTLGFYSVRSFHVPMFLGSSKQLVLPKGIAAVRLDRFERKKKGKSCELTVYGVNSGPGEIFYNKSMTAANWAGKGRGGLWKLKDADGIAALPDGLVAVAESGAGRVVLLENRESGLEYIRKIGEGGGEGEGEAPTKEGILTFPVGVAIDRSRRIWVADRDSGKVIVFSEEGEVVSVLNGLERPTAIAVADSTERWLFRKSNSVFVVDGDGKRISRHSFSGKRLAETTGSDFGVPGARFNGLAVDYYMQIWAVDLERHTVYKFDGDLGYIASFGTEGESGAGRFLHPWGLTIWKKFGQMFVTQENGAEYYWIGVDLLESGYKPLAGGGVGFRFEFSEAPVLDLGIRNGRSKIRSLLDGRKLRARSFRVDWNGKDDKGGVVPPGEYTLELKASATYSSREHFNITRRIPFTISAAAARENPAGSAD